MKSKSKVVAYILLNISTGRELDVLKYAKKLNGVTEARLVYGEYDGIVRVEVDEIKELDKVVLRLRAHDGVLRTVTLLSSEVNEYKMSEEA